MELRETLLAIGARFGDDGKAIHGTRHWKVLGEGKVRFTSKGDVPQPIIPGNSGDLVRTRIDTISA